MLKLSKYVFMKPFILLVMFFLLGAVIPSLSGADHVIEFPTVEPSDILIGTPANVKATIQVGAEFGLIAQSVNLLRLDEDGRTIAILGSMKDDGVAPDDLQGDNIYSMFLN